MVEDCWFKKKSEGNNVATSNQKKDNNKEWETKASITIEKEKLTLQSQYLAKSTTRVIGSSTQGVQIT